MKKLIITASGALAAVAASLAVAGPAAAAPDQTGQSYGNASAALSAAGFYPVVSTTVGDKVSRDQCTVIGQQTTVGSPFLGGAGPHGEMIQGNGKPKVMLSLDCNHPAK